MIETKRTARPSWTVELDAKKFFIDVQNDDGGTEKRLMRLETAVLVITLPYPTGHVERVAFMKSSRGKNFRDSRGKKVDRKPKNDFGDKTTGLAPLYLSADECQAELTRLLDDSWEAARAFDALNV